MPQNIDFSLYLNIVFLSTLGLGLFFGFLRGMKKAMWGFVVTLIFIAAFFLTLDQVINILWTINLPFLGGVLASVSPDLSGVTSLQDALPILLNTYLGDTLNTAVTNEHLLEFLTSLSLFVLKLVYALLYFTVIQVLYRLILWIIKMIVVPSRKKTDKYKSKNRTFGALFGLMSGALSLYLTIILFGGFVSISESLITVLPEENPAEVNYYVELSNTSFTKPNESILPTMEAINLPVPNQSYEDAYNLINDMVTSYNDNIVIKLQNQVTMTSEYTDEEMPLNLYLFDSVLSMEYQEEQIAIREELSIYSEVAGLVLDNPFMTSNNLSDIEGDDIREVFNTLSESNLFTSLVPLAVEVGSEMYETNIDIPVDELYEIDWKTEISELGNIAATTFDIINAAGILNDNVDLATVQLDGDEVESLFDSLGESQLVTLAAYVAIEPLTEMAGESFSGFITVPADINWEDEFSAIGDLAGAILNTDLTVGDIESNDATAILTALSEVDFTVLLNSKIITNAMINILSGETSINVDFLNIPADIVWLDTEVDGVMVNGELHNILSAINALTSSLGDIDITDFENLSIQTIADLDLTSINSIFESRILVATITDYLADLDFGDYSVIIPDSVYDEDGYLLKKELQNIVTAVQMVLDNLTCDVGDTACEEVGFDFNKILTLSSDNIDILLTPDILAATVGNILIELGGDVLTIPGSSLTEISVNEVSRDVVSRSEIKNAFLAISVIGITDIENIDVDISILNNLGTEADPTVLDQDKADLLFASSILNATLSSYLIDYSLEDGAFITVPYMDQSGTSIRLSDPVDGTEYISETELTNILQAILVLDIQDINSFETLDISSILDNVSTLLDSAILHASVSKLLLDLTDVITVPLNNQAGNPLKITTGPVGQKTTFIDKTELEAAIDALQVLGINDIDNITIDVSILSNLGTEADPTVLDTAKSDQLFSSSIINATLSSYIIDLASGTDSFIVVPFESEDGTTIRTIDSADGTEYITRTELTNILKAILALDLQDFDSLESFSLDTIIDNLSVLLDSAILHASVSKQLIDLGSSVITIPENDQLGNPLKITRTGLDSVDYVYIARSELEATMDALQVLEITDINNVTIDATILNNLGTEADPTVLDTDKADRLFSSSIINATLSSYLIDFTSGPDPFIVVPFRDQDNNVIRSVDAADGTEYISQSELTNILKAILILDLQDFNSVETLDLNTLISNSSTLLDSAILHASISKQFINLGSSVVTIPENDQLGNPLRITVGTGAEEVEYIVKDELNATFDSLDVLGITDINNISIDVSILNNLAVDGSPTVLDTSKADRLFASSIITATLSSYLTDFSDEANPLIIVPYEDESGVAIRTTDPADGTEYISQTELTNILKSILVLQLTDFNTVDTLSLTTIIDNKDVLLDSAIMQATISKQLFDLGDSVITIPYKSETDQFIRKTVGDTGEETEFITKAEMEALLDSLSVLGITGINDFSGTIDLQNIISDSGKIDTLLASSIIQATISKQLFDLGDSVITIPYRDETNVNDIRVTRGDTGEETEYIVVSELKAVFDSLNVLGIYDVTSFGGSIDLSLLDSPGKVDTLVASTIIQATISKQVIDLTNDSGAATTVIVPYKTDIGDIDLRVSVGPTGHITEMIIRSEVKDLIEAFLALGFTSVDDMSSAISLTSLADNATTVFESYIVQATVSKQVIDLGVSGTIVVPYYEDDNSTRIRNITGPVGNLTEYISKSELESMVQALKLLNATSVDGFDGAIDISLFYDLTTRTTLLESSILQATISKQIVDLGSAIIVPTKAADTVTDIRFNVGSGSEVTEYISKPEIHALFEVLELWGMDDITDFNGTIELTLFLPSQTSSYDANQDILLASASIQATISKQILDLGTSGELIVPSTDVSDIAIVVTSDTTEFIYKSEIKHLINAMDLLNVSDITTFDGSISLGKLFESTAPLDYDTNQDTMLASAIMHATLSDQILSMDGNSLTVPVEDVSGAAIKKTVSTNFFIVKDEIKALLNALDILGAPTSGFDSFSGTIGIDALNNSSDQDKILSSATMHATISKKLFDINTDPLNPIMIFPETDIREDPDKQILIDYADVTFIEINELKSLLNALNEMNLTSFGSVSITPSIILGKDNTVITDSAIMQATISDKILDGATDESTATSGTLIVPTYFREDITVDGSTSKWIERSELMLLLDSLDVLGISDFDGGVSGGSFNTMTSSEIDTLVASGSMHTTVDFMLKSNNNINTSIPNIATTSVSYVSYSVITKIEIRHFILATQVIAGPGDDISNINLDANSLSGLTASEQSIMLDSIIVRCKITPDLEITNTFDPVDDYEAGSVPSTLTKAAIEAVI